MNHIMKNESERIISLFLDQLDQPTTEDWKRLMEQYPMYAADISDAAMVRAAGDVAENSDEEYVFDSELASRSVSRALNRLHRSSSTTLHAAQQKVNALKGPAAKKEAAIAVGIGTHLSLFNGVLAGRVEVPSKLLNAMSSFFDAPAIVLAEVFRRNFAATPVPHFKAGDMKPQIAAEPSKWEDAVRELKPAADELERLLSFVDER